MDPVTEDYAPINSNGPRSMDLATIDIVTMVPATK
jgi:hypothetical protein